MIFIETPLFTKRIQSMLPDELYAELQHLLALHPNAGDIIRGSGGLRKIRWKAPGKGKEKEREVGYASSIIGISLMMSSICYSFTRKANKPI